MRRKSLVSPIGAPADSSGPPSYGPAEGTGSAGTYGNGMPSPLGGLFLFSFFFFFSGSCSFNFGFCD